MAEIFISYAHKDVDRAKRVVDALQRRGWSVWWDPGIRSGASFIIMINEQIQTANAVLVLWSRSSVTSRWVIEEAHFGLVNDVLFPVLIDDDTQLPVGFATVQYVDLSDWKDDAPVGGFDQMLDELAERIGAPSGSSAAAPQPVPASPPRHMPTPEPEGPPPLPSGASVPPEAPPPLPASPRMELSPGPPPAAGSEPTPRGRGNHERFIDLSEIRLWDYPFMALLAVGVAMQVADMLGRWVLGAPLGLGAHSLMIMAVSVVAFFGIGITERTGRGVVAPVSLLIQRGAARSVMAVLRPLASTVLFTVASWAVAMHAIRAQTYGAVSVDGGVPLSMLYGVIAVALLVAAVGALFRVVHGLSARA